MLQAADKVQSVEISTAQRSAMTFLASVRLVSVEGYLNGPVRRHPDLSSMLIYANTHSNSRIFVTPILSILFSLLLARD